MCGNTSLIETIESLAQKVSGIRSYAHAKSEALNDSRRDHIAMIKALRNSRRDELIEPDAPPPQAGGAGLYRCLRSTARPTQPVMKQSCLEAAFCSPLQQTS